MNNFDDYFAFVGAGKKRKKKERKEKQYCLIQNKLF